MQATRVTNTQHGTDDDQNPWCVVEETTHRDYYDNSSIRRVCTVNSILTRRSFDRTTSSASSANVQEPHGNRARPLVTTDDSKQVSSNSKKSQKKAKSRRRRGKFLRALLCCSGGGDADDDVYGTKPTDPPMNCSVNESVTDGAHDQDRPSENVPSTSGRTEYIPTENEWMIIPEYVDYHRQTASSGEYDATVTQAVRRQSAISTAQDSSVIHVVAEQRHYECTLARVSQDLDSRRARVGSSLVIRELSPTRDLSLTRELYTTREVSPTSELSPSREISRSEATPRNTENASPLPNLTSEKQSDSQTPHRRRSVKPRVSFSSETNFSSKPRPLKRSRLGCPTPSPLSAVSSFSLENSIHECEGETDTSMKHEHVNTVNPINVDTKKVSKSALKVRGVSALSPHNDVTGNNDIHKKSTRLEELKKDLVVKRRSDGSTYVAKKSYNTSDCRSVDSAQVLSRSELRGEIKEPPRYILVTPELSRNISTHEKKASSSTLKLSRKPRTMDNVADMSYHSTNADINLNKSLGSALQKPINRQEQEEREWIVRRRSDGSRYVAKRYKDNNNTSARRSDEMTCEDKIKRGQKQEMHISDNCRNTTIEPPRDKRNQSPSVSTTTEQKSKSSAADSSITRQKRHRPVRHRDLDWSSAELLAVL